jgi:dihydropteroate synthase
VGVVNVTPDSFSDGGEWLEPSAAISHGMELLAEGADIIDVGGESTRPGAIRPRWQKSFVGSCLWFASSLPRALA